MLVAIIELLPLWSELRDEMRSRQLRRRQTCGPGCPVKTLRRCRLWDTPRRQCLAAARPYSLLSPQIVWHQPGNNRFSDTKNGIAEFGAMMEIAGGTFAITRADRYLANSDLVAIEIEFAGERPGAKLSQPGIDLLRIANGKIVEVWLFSSDPEQEDAFWGE